MDEELIVSQQDMGKELAHAAEVLHRALQRVFTLNAEIYRMRGIGVNRIGFGKWPAILNIDLANAWTKPDYLLACDGMTTIIPGVQRLLAAGREKKIPIVFTTMAYSVPSGPNTDAGTLALKVPIEFLRVGSEAVEIDERIAPLPDEQVIVKKRASAFHGTYLAGFLRSARVDTVIVTGVTCSACVRNTVEDALSEGFRPIVVRECVGDRIAGAIEWNLFDIDAKFGDVEPLEKVLVYLESLTPRQVPRAAVATTV